MIYTITLNPAIDHIILFNDPISLAATNYYDKDYQVIGGKGINVGIILKNLDVDVQVIGIMGSENKDIFINKFSEINLNTNFFFNQGKTRVNYKIKHLKTKQETELNGYGFSVEQEVMHNFFNYLQTHLTQNDIVVISGSVAKGFSNDIYQKIGALVNEKKALLICDAAGELLQEVLKEKPFLIKPNLEEVFKTLKKDYIKNISFFELKNLIKQLKKMGARNVLLSMGQEGSYFFKESGEIYKISSAQGVLINSVGAGDSMVAGFVYGISKKFITKKTLQYAAAAGAATAFNEWLASKEEIKLLVDQIKVKKMKEENLWI